MKYAMKNIWNWKEVFLRKTYLNIMFHIKNYIIGE